jgi:membrane peptidoglycan carboxypeptidase
MDKKQANIEMEYRLIKYVLAAMLDDGLITDDEYEAARLELAQKLKPLIGSLE